MYFNAQKEVFIVDRIKELIKVRGYQVPPAELEAVLIAHEDVADAAVVGVTIRGEEWPRAYVVKAAGSKASERDIAKWMEGKVARHKRLKGGVAFVDAVPKNPVSLLMTSSSYAKDVLLIYSLLIVR